MTRNNKLSLDTKWGNHIVPHDSTYYTKCILGGMLTTGVTHTILTPIDLVKCNMQANPTKYVTMMGGLRTMMTEQGISSLRRGWTSTAIGYSLQGAGKFGLYEYFKDMFSTMANQDEERTSKDQGMIYLAASASAELFATVLLCPMEMIKVKEQTSPVTPASSIRELVKVTPGYPFGSLVPLLGRQIPYTMTKFVVYEKIVSDIHSSMFGRHINEGNKAERTFSFVTAGYLTGIVCAIVSNPADSLVTLMGTSTHSGKSMAQISSDVDFATLATKGLGPRMFLIGTLTAAQFFIYESFKDCVGIDVPIAT